MFFLKLVLFIQLFFFLLLIFIETFNFFTIPREFHEFHFQKWLEFVWILLYLQTKLCNSSNFLNFACTLSQGSVHKRRRSLRGGGDLKNLVYERSPTLSCPLSHVQLFTVFFIHKKLHNNPSYLSSSRWMLHYVNYVNLFTVIQKIYKVFFCCCKRNKRKTKSLMTLTYQNSKGGKDEKLIKLHHVSKFYDLVQTALERVSI